MWNRFSILVFGGKNGYKVMRKAWTYTTINQCVYLAIYKGSVKWGVNSGLIPFVIVIVIIIGCNFTSWRWFDSAKKRWFSLSLGVSFQLESGWKVTRKRLENGEFARCRFVPLCDNVLILHILRLSQLSITITITITITLHA